MYRSFAALVLLIVLAFSQGASANVYESNAASGPTILVSGHADYLQPYVVFLESVSAGFVKLPTTRLPAFHATLVAEAIALSGIHLVSLSSTSDHDKTWITEVTTLLYPAHEFS